VRTREAFHRRGRWAKEPPPWRHTNQVLPRITWAPIDTSQLWGTRTRPAAIHGFADVIVGIALQPQFIPLQLGRATETLTGDNPRREIEAATKTGGAWRPGDFTRQSERERLPVGVDDRQAAA